MHSTHDLAMLAVHSVLKTNETAKVALFFSKQVSE